jgi:DNA-binding MarR family transcriptional regulator
MDVRPRAEEVSSQVLLEAALGCYTQAVQTGLEAARVEGLPQNGLRVLEGMVYRRRHARAVTNELGLSKQAASQLIDRLDRGGFVERQINPEDCRRVTVTATRRGRIAAAAAHLAIDEVDTELTALLSAGELLGFGAALAALREIGSRRKRV